MKLQEFLEKFDTEFLEEKLIMFNQGKPYGQIVILAGSAGSGKSFVKKQYMDSSSFNTIDVDKMKTDFIKLARLMDIHKPLQNIDLSKQEDVRFVHEYISDLGIKNKIVNNILRAKSVDRLPNLIFDITLKDPSDFEKIAKVVMPFGYQPENIHLVYVITNFEIAHKRNLDRTRRVPPDIFYKTAYGSASTMVKYLRGKLPSEINGRVDIVLNNESAEKYTKKSDRGGSFIEDFTYLNVKKERKRMNSEGEVRKTWEKWVKQNAPKEVIQDLEL